MRKEGRASAPDRTVRRASPESLKYTILMGSPRRKGNTAALLRPFLEENGILGVEQDVIYLYDREIRPCLGCKVCQNVTDRLGCVQEDDLEQIFHSIQTSDVVVFATPVYSWFCTPPMKALMDRLIYAGCKYYGAQRQPSAYGMKQVASIVTCGYPTEKGADLWEEGLRRWCRHGDMDYLGCFCVRDTATPGEFETEQVETDIRDFAHALHLMVAHSM